MANWSLPTITDLYTNLITYFRDRDIDCARMFSTAFTAATNIQTGTIRWNDTNKYWERYDGSWTVLTSLYGIDVSGNAATATLAAAATKLATARTINGVSFNGEANINNVPSYVAGVNNTDTTQFPLMALGNAAGVQQVYTDVNFYWNGNINTLVATNFSGNGAGITSLNMGNAASGTLAVARGGTGVTTKTGTGANVQASSPTITSAILNTGVSGSAIDTTVTTSTSKVPRSGAVKSYVDSKFLHGRANSANSGTVSGGTGWTITSGLAGTCVITHNLGHSNYTVNLTAVGAVFTAYCCTLNAKGNTSFAIQILRVSGTPSWADAVFDFVVMED